MPCETNELAILPYLLPARLGRTVREEAAARILIFSQEAGMWVGVSLRALAARMQDEMDRDREYRRQLVSIREAEEQETRRVAKFTVFYWLGIVLTFGILLFFTKKPVAKTFERPAAPPAPASLVPLIGSIPVMIGMRELVELGLIEHDRRTLDYRSAPEDVVFPTPRLVSIVTGREKFSQN